MVESFSEDLLPAVKSFWTESQLELLILLRLNSGASHQPAFMDSSLTLVTRIWPVYLVDELVLGVLQKVIGQSRKSNSVKY